MVVYEQIGQLAAETVFTADQILAIGFWVSFFGGILSLVLSILVFRLVRWLLNRFTSSNI